MQQLESGEGVRFMVAGWASPPSARCPCCDYLSNLQPPLSLLHSAQAVLVSGNVSHRVKCDSGESSAQTRGVRTRQTNLRAGPCLCLWARNDNKGWEMQAILFEPRIEFLSLFVIPGLKLTDCCHSRVHWEFPQSIIVKVRPPVSRIYPNPAKNILRSIFVRLRPRLWQACPVSHRGLLTTGAVASNCDHASGGDDPGGDHWPTSTILSRYRSQHLGQQQPHIRRQSLQLGDHGILHNPD